MFWLWAYRWRAAIVTIGVGVLAALMRLTTLGYPTSLVFDEVFYARGAYSLVAQGYEGDWSGEDQLFAEGDYSGLSTRGDYVVHPMVGKLLIAAGIEVFGPTPFGWRIAAAVFGIATVMLVVPITRTLLGSTLWGGVAGLLLAVDGLHITMSRTALLDGFLTFFVVAGFGLIVLDRQWFRRRLGEALEAAGPDGRRGAGPMLGVRWWRLLAILAFALAASTKWSGLYFAAVFLVLSVVWDMAARRDAGIERWLLGSALRAIPTFVATIVIIPVTYVATWWNWFATDGSYARQWAEKHPGEGVLWLPEPLRSLVDYHRQMWDFHTTLTSPHSYESHPNGWLLQVRPTAFYFEDVPGIVGDERYVSAITSLGNPLIWWAGFAALLFAVWRLLLHRDTMGLVMSLGVLAGWLPWVPYAHRTIFTFYAVVFAPFLVMLVAWAMQRIAQPHGPRTWSRGGWIAVGVFIGVVLIVSGYYLPLWRGDPIPYDLWRLHMWLPTWI